MTNEAERLDRSMASVDSTSCRAHQHAAGAPKNPPPAPPSSSEGALRRSILLRAHITLGLPLEEAVRQVKPLAAVPARHPGTTGGPHPVRAGHGQDPRPPPQARYPARDPGEEGPHDPRASTRTGTKIATRWSGPSESSNSSEPSPRDTTSAGTSISAPSPLPPSSFGPDRDRSQNPGGAVGPSAGMARRLRNQARRRRLRSLRAGRHSRAR